jgi:hypothetical protein
MLARTHVTLTHRTILELVQEVEVGPTVMYTTRGEKWMWCNFLQIEGGAA